MNKFNSNVQFKEGCCIDCLEKGDDTKKPLIAGRCGYHYSVQQKLKSYKKAREGKTGLFKPPMKIVKDQELEEWFESKAIALAQMPICSECGSTIPEKYYRHATAHIFPKSIFPSVKTHPLNYVFACANNGCHNRTHRLDTFSQMKCFGEAVEKFICFKDSITEKHKYLDEFLEYALKN